jgi:hypothetical protein
MVEDSSTGDLIGLRGTGTYSGITKPRWAQLRENMGKTWIEGREIPHPTIHELPPSAHVTGDIDSLAVLAGQAVRPWE